MGDNHMLEKHRTEPIISVISGGNGTEICANGRHTSLVGGQMLSFADLNDHTKCPAEGNETVDGDEADEDSGPCGWGRLRFQFCQRFRDARWFLVVLTLCGACQGLAVNGLVHTVISTLEKRFEISSTESGLISSCYDIMFVVMVIPISYFGGHGHKPRYLGVGFFVLGLGSFLFSLPHFITDKYHVKAADEMMCNIKSNITASCHSDNPSGLSNYKYFFYFGQVLHGAGATPLYTLGATFIDDNVSQRSSAFYNGIFYTGSIIGPAIGFILGARFLDMYVDFGVDSESLGLDTSNPKWVGAWWLGFMISGTFAILLSLPLLAFPRAMPGSHKFAAERGKETQASSTSNETTQAHGVRDILHYLKCLLTNVPFMLINFAAAADGILLSGFSTFMPKFIEYEFGLPAGTSALYVGFAVVPAGGGATLAGGVIVKCFSLRMRGILRFCAVTSSLLCIMAVALLMECDTSPFAGITLPYRETNVESATFLGKNLLNSCNENCSCEETDFFPMCGRDNVMYFSPCYAGCTDMSHDIQAMQKYSDCSCVNYNLTATDYAENKTYVGELGKCEQKCKWLTPFLVCFAIMIVFVFIISMPSLTATLRCVPEHQRSFGLGIQWIVARCLGSIPGPILFGKMFDMACLVWQKQCDGGGSCFFYDNHMLTMYLLALALTFSVTAAVSFMFANCFYKVREVDDDITLKVAPPSGNAVAPISNGSAGHPNHESINEVSDGFYGTNL